jgi:Na+-transporting NADH:ubiquinone oxidoreductase subunit NqrC
LASAPVAGASAVAGSAAAICAKVSAVSVSAVVGYKLPAPSANTLTLPATKKNDEISSVVTSCTYGAQTLAALPKDVIIDYAVTSRALTAADVKKGLAQANQIKITIVPYHGLGVTAYYYSFSESGIAIQGLTGFEGTKEYGGSTYSKTTSKSQLAALVRLAEKL